MPKTKNGLPVTLHSPVCSKMFADEKRAVTCTKTRRVNAFTNMEVRHIFGIVKKYAILLNSCFLSLSRNESASSIYTFSKKLGKRIRTVIVSVLTGYESYSSSFRFFSRSVHGHLKRESFNHDACCCGNASHAGGD